MKRDSHGRPARVVFWAGSFEQAGTQRFLVELLRRLDRAAFRPTVFSVLKEGPLLSEIERLEVPVLEFRTGRSPASAATLRGLTAAAAHLWRERVDIVSPMLGITTLFGPLVARAAGVPVVVNHQRNLSYWIDNRLEERAYGFVSRSVVDAVLVNSRAAGDELADRFRVPARKIVDVGVGIDVRRFDGVERDRRLAADLGLGGAPVVGIVGKLSPVKGHEFFLEAAAAVARERGDVRFLVVGDGTRRAELEGLAAALGLSGRVVFAGARNDVPAVLRLMDVFTLSSVSEGAPHAVMEAMAAGLPIVATDVGGVMDVVGGPSAAVLVPPRDPSAMARGILRLLQDPSEARAMGAALGRAARERHDVGAVVRRVEDAFLRVLAERAPHRVPACRRSQVAPAGIVRERVT